MVSWNDFVLTSGLSERVLQSTTTEQDAEKQVNAIKFTPAFPLKIEYGESRGFIDVDEGNLYVSHLSERLQFIRR